MELFTDNYNERIVTLVDLFRSINITEKGIEKVYDYLLINHFIYDIKGLSEKLNLNIKRIYKILSVLKDLGLIQIYSRPMTVQILDPQTSWEKIIQDRVNEIKKKANEEIQFCKESFSKIKKIYNIKEAPESPIEFIPLIGDFDIESTMTSILSDRISLIARGIWYEFNFEYLFKRIVDFNHEEKNSIKSIYENLNKNLFKVLINNEYYENIKIKIEKYGSLVSILKQLGVSNLNMELKITNKQFSNFVIKDQKSLIQPNFDPNDILIGYFISSTPEIINIFEKKFNELYENAELLQNKYKLNEEELILIKFLIIF